MWFVFDDAPWFARGWYHAYGVTAGVFTYNHERAMAASWVSFRVVITMIY